MHVGLLADLPIYRLTSAKYDELAESGADFDGVEPFAVEALFERAL